MTDRRTNVTLTVALLLVAGCSGPSIDAADVGDQGAAASLDELLQPNGDPADPSTLLGGDVLLAATVDEVEPSDRPLSTVTLVVDDVLWAGSQQVNDETPTPYDPPTIGASITTGLNEVGVARLEMGSRYLFVLSDRPAYDDREVPETRVRLVLKPNGETVGVTPDTDALMQAVLAGTSDEDRLANTVAVVADATHLSTEGAVGRDGARPGLLHDWRERNGYRLVEEPASDSSPRP